MKFSYSIFLLGMAFCFAFPLNEIAANENKQKNNDFSDASVIFCSESKKFDVFASFIYWTAKEPGADAWAEVIITDSTSSTNDILEVSFGWDAGFRVGVGYQLQHVLWDTKGYYTRFHTKGKDSVASKPGAVHSTFLGNFYVDNPFGIGISGPSYEKASIDWSIHFNMFDWEFGCNHCVCKNLLLRSFMGIKGGWIDQSIHSKWETPEILGITFSAIGTENLKNDFWGLGPVIGIDTKWIVCCNKGAFYLFGNYSAAVMWGHWSFSDIYENDFSQEIIVDLQNLNGGASTLRSFMGIGWDASFCNKAYSFSAKLGYEMQFWLDQLQFYSFTGGRLVNELTLQGGTIEFCFDF